MQSIIVILAFVLTVADSLALAGPSKNVVYKLLVKTLWPIAEQGDASAQNILGVIYSNGDGVRHPTLFFC